MAAENDKSQRPQAEEKSVFFWFGNRPAIHGQAQGVAGEIGMGGGLVSSGIELAHVEVGQNAGPAPRNGVAESIEMIGADANS